MLKLICGNFYAVIRQFLSRKINIPFPCVKFAQILVSSLAVDHELNENIDRKMEIIRHPPSVQMTFSAPTCRLLRVSVNSMLESVKLVLRCMAELHDISAVNRPERLVSPELAPSTDSLNSHSWSSVQGV